MANARSPRLLRSPKPDRRRALELLAGSRDGMTEAMLAAHGFTVKQMLELVRDGLASAHSQRVVVGRHTIKIARVKITEAGRQAFADRPQAVTKKSRGKSQWAHTPREAVMATIIPWDDGLGVSYSYHDGAAEAHAIGPEDWPVIRAFENDGKLSFASKRARDGLAKLRKLGLDH